STVAKAGPPTRSRMDARATSRAPRSSPSTAPDTGCTTTASTSYSPCGAASSESPLPVLHGEREMGLTPSQHRSSNKRIALPLLTDRAHRPMAADEDEVVAEREQLGLDGVD